MGEVQERLGMESSASFQVGDLLNTATGARVPEVEKVVKCVIRILARPVRIVSLVDPLRYAPRDAIVTEYHPVEGMTSEEIEREVFWLVSHEEKWHTAVTSSIEVVRGSAERPMEYEGQVCREPVHYSLDLHPLIDLATFTAEMSELTPPATAAN
jgi:hypothetical protein